MTSIRLLSSRCFSPSSSQWMNSSSSSCNLLLPSFSSSPSIALPLPLPLPLLLPFPPHRSFSTKPPSKPSPSSPSSPSSPIPISTSPVHDLPPESAFEIHSTPDNTSVDWLFRMPGVRPTYAMDCLHVFKSTPPPVWQDDSHYPEWIYDIDVAYGKTYSALNQMSPIDMSERDIKRYIKMTRKKKIKDSNIDKMKDQLGVMDLPETEEEDGEGQ